MKNIFEKYPLLNNEINSVNNVDIVRDSPYTDIRITHPSVSGFISAESITLTSTIEELEKKFLYFFEVYGRYPDSIFINRQEIIKQKEILNYEINNETEQSINIEEVEYDF